MPCWLALLNSLMGIGSTVAATVAVLRPTALAPAYHLPTNAAEHASTAKMLEAVKQIHGYRFYPAMYAARAVPLGIIIAIVVWLTPVPPTTQLVLAVAVLAQLTDFVTGVRYQRYGMAAGGIMAATCHITGLVTSL